MLGFCAPLDEGEEITRFDFQSKAGGRPAWLNPEKALTAEQLTNVRGEVLDFICQIYAPLGGDDEGGSADTFHRVLYVFASRTGAPEGISSSIKVFRCQLPRHNKFYPAEEPELRSLLSDVEEPEEPFAGELCTVTGLRTATRCAEMGGLPYSSQQHQKLHWKMSKRGRKEAEASGMEYVWDRPSVESLVREGALVTEFALYDEEEPEGKGDDLSVKEMNKISKMVDSNKEREKKEGEYTQNDFKGWKELFKQKKDASYDAFRTVISKAPGQALRYARNGMPLWASEEHQAKEGDIPAAPDGSPRIFEFQLMPPLLFHLNLEGTLLKNALEAKQQSTLDFGTVAIYTSSGGEPGEYIEEVAWVQPYNV